MTKAQHFMMGPFNKLSLQVPGNARKRLQQLAESLHDQHNTDAGIHVVEGAIVDEILATAKALTADLIVCGAIGNSILRPLLLGSTSERLLAKSVCSVLIVKKAPNDQYRRLLVPVDFSHESLRAVKHAQTLPPQAEITLLHVVDALEGLFRMANLEDEEINQHRMFAKQEATRKLQALSEETGLSGSRCHLVVLRGEPAQRILDWEQECDLVVTGKPSGSKLNQFLMGKTFRQVLTLSQHVILVSIGSGRQE